MTREEMVDAAVRASMSRRTMEILLDKLSGDITRSIRERARAAGDAWDGHWIWCASNDELAHWIFKQSFPGRLVAIHRAFARLSDQ